MRSHLLEDQIDVKTQGGHVVYDVHTEKEKQKKSVVFGEGIDAKKGNRNVCLGRQFEISTSTRAELYFEATSGEKSYKMHGC